MSFEALAESGPYCDGDTIVINFCDCPIDNLIAIRTISPSPAPALTFTPITNGVEITGTGVDTYVFEIRCCRGLVQDFDNPYTQIYFPP